VSGIGTQLREERIRRNLALDDIARETRISSRYLQAIETEDYARLPGLVFTRNFVRQYALELKMDPAPLMERLPKLDESMVRLPDPPATSRVRQWNRQSSPVLTSAAWLLLLGGAGVAGYYHFNGLPRLRIELLPSAQTTAKAASKAVNSEPRQSSAKAPEPAAIQPEPSPAVTPATIAPPAAPSPEAPSSRAVQVVVTAREPAWVQVTADGKHAFTGTLMPNETKAVSADGQVRVLTGNAGGVTISLNGKTLDPLGPQGQVRSVRLTVDGPEFPAAKTAAVADPL
jgi:cytoskeleton protein RodZ